MAGNNDFMEFGFDSGDDSIQGGKFERFKGKQGETYRMSFVWWDMKEGKPNLDAPSPRFIGARRHFIPNVGYVLDHGPEYSKLAGGPPKPTIATIVALWPLDHKGELDKARFQQGDVDVKPWVFSQDKYEQLKRRHAEWPFGMYDMKVACTDSQYQKMDIGPCKDNLFRRVVESEKMRALTEAILAKVADIVGANPQGEPLGLRNIIARDMTIDKIREKLGGAASSAGASGMSSADTTSQIDDLLDDLIQP